MSDDERDSAIVLKMLGTLLSPTRAIIDCWKNYQEPSRGRKTARLRYWSLGWFLMDVLVVLLIAFADVALCDISIPRWIMFLCAYVSLSRINEIVYAFYNDARRVMRRDSPGTFLSPENRLIMAMRSYWALVVNFALIYYVLPGLFGGVCGVHFFYQDRGASAALDFIDAFYFSGITIATIGYGDVVPVHATTKLLTLYEVFAGMLIVVVAIAGYWAAPSRGRARRRR